MSVSNEELLSPAKWVEQLRSRGIYVSERKLRTKAREYGQFYALGQTMILHRRHIDAIFQEEAGAHGSKSKK